MPSTIRIDTTDSESIDHTELGNAMIELLGLRVKANGRVNTTWGDKTPHGLVLTVLRMAEEHLGEQQ